MLDPIIGFFEKLIDDFSWRRLLLLVVILSLMASFAWMYESYTDSFQLKRMEKQVELLEKLVNLNSNKAIIDNQELQSIYRGLNKNLNALNSESAAIVLSPPVTQTLAALLPWLLLMMLLLLFKKKTGGEAAAGVAVVSIPVAFIGYWLPQFEQAWINYVLYPVASFVLLIGAVIWWQGTKNV
ncbi:hypothetical protein [Denitrificimonas caeni]|uniref:hypothetical protein n=1 Tax=Denitrificimonas caeni TaxID=521720 RepID=UPI0019651A21|nr:hypothetical protein [Denitrificimonas caeni]